MINVCSGCGAVLQQNDEKSVGYTPLKNAKMCQRCFKLKNYNQKEIVNLKYSNEEIIDLINKNAEVVFFITDFLNVSKKVIEEFNKIKKRKYLIINKLDYIPKSINSVKYLDWLKSTYSICDDILLISAKKKLNLNELNNLVLKNKNSYICGYTNSGKSSIINALCELNGKDSKILSSLMPNTTLDIIKVNISKENWIYDTPGFISDVEFNENNHPKKYLKPVTLQIKKNDIVNIDDKIYIKSSCGDNSFTFYISELVKIQKFYNEEKINLKLEVDIDSNSDLLINGYGFINIKNKDHLLITDNCGDIELRSSMF